MKKQNNILGFTIGEVLVTMLIITLMTLASIPIAKNAKMKKELPIDKNYWAAMYENGQLVVKEGKKGEAPKTTTYPSGTEIPFTPPKGVSKLNVTVIGGGGGGAAGVSRTGAAEIFFPDTSVKKSVFSPV